jgi:hypothetical protein
MSISMGSLARSIGAKALVGVGERVEAWASKPKEESFTTQGTVGDPTFFADDLGWIPAAMGEQTYMSADIRPIDRMMLIRRARLYYTRDAMSKQAVRLHTVYCVGRGMSIKARDYKNNNADVKGSTNPSTDDAILDPGIDTADELDNEALQLQKDADSFWEHPDNAPVFSVEAQSRMSDRLNVDGNLFYILIPPDAANIDDITGEPMDDGITRVRAINDCLQIARIIKNPEDDSEVWYYLRQWWEGGKEKKRLYPDHHLFFRGRDAQGKLHLPTIGQTPTLDPNTVYGGDLDGVQIKHDQFIYHQRVNTITDWGNSLLTPAMDWSKVNRRYLENRATISEAHAKFAWKRMIKGPASAVASFGRKSISAAQPTVGIPVQAAVGQTLNVNSGMDWQPVNAQDGGKNAYIESRNFRLMFYSAVGFAEHYFGDGSMGTRATSTSMERPTELMLQAYQLILKSGYEVMFAFHLTAMGRAYDAHAVWVDAPQVLEDDLAATITSILSVIGVLPQFDIDEIILKMLNTFGIDDPQDVLVKIRARQAELYQQNLELAAIQSGLADAQQGAGSTDPTADPAGHQAAQAKLVAAQGKFLQMVSPPSDPTKEPGPKIGAQFAQGGSRNTPLVMRKPTPSRLRPNSAATP